MLSLLHNILKSLSAKLGINPPSRKRKAKHQSQNSMSKRRKVSSVQLTETHTYANREEGTNWKHMLYLVVTECQAFVAVVRSFFLVLLPLGSKVST